MTGPEATAGVRKVRGAPPKWQTTGGSLSVDRLLTVSDLAKLLAVEQGYVYRLVSERRVPYLKWGHYVRFDPKDVARWLEAAKIKPAEQRGIAEARRSSTRNQSRRSV